MIATSPRTDDVIFLNGSYGVGKSAVLDHVGDLLAGAGRPSALMDVDWFHRSWPPADHDPDNVLTEAANMAAAWTNYRRAGPRQLVVSGVIATAADRERHERAFGLVVRSVRLEADQEVLSSRLRSRYPKRAAALAWHLDRYQQLARRLADADSDELIISTDDLTPRAVAERVLHHFDRSPSGPTSDPTRAGDAAAAAAADADDPTHAGTARRAHSRPAVGSGRAPQPRLDPAHRHSRRGRAAGGGVLVCGDGVAAELHGW